MPKQKMLPRAKTLPQVSPISEPIRIWSPADSGLATAFYSYIQSLGKREYRPGSLLDGAI